MRETLSARELIGRALYAPLKPPPRRPISQWADEKFYLSAESSAEAGKWKSMPFQPGILDAFSDPRVTYISVMKSARVGWTKMINIVCCQAIDEDPCSIMVVQPTVEDAEGYSKEEIAPMLRDVPCVHGKVADAGSKDGDNTILGKKYPGGVLAFVGANSGRGFRRVSRKKVLLDEIDAYPPTAGNDGDQYRLAEKRTLWFWDRKVGAGSTPLVHGASRIEKLFIAGDQRRFYVPCPHCGHMDHLVFRREKLTDNAEDDDHDGMVRVSPGHVMTWDSGKPESAYFVCSQCGACIDESHKHWMIERGEWRAAKPFEGHASFHIWAAYSFAPNATWGQIAKEFVEAVKEGVEALRTFVNTVLGETWRERGDAPPWKQLYNRRETYRVGTCPRGVLFLTAAIDVQKRGLYYEVVGWGRGKESWSIDRGFLPGDPSTLDAPVWREADALVARIYPTALGLEIPIQCVAIDSGDNTQTVYNWARQYPLNRVIAIKGVESKGILVGKPSLVDVDSAGNKIKDGYQVWPVSGDMAKTEFYGWLRLTPPSAEALSGGANHPAGFCHFPEYDEDYFKQITAEQMVSHRNRRGFVVMTWERIPGRDNHYLDCRVYARAAAQVAGLDRATDSDWQQLEHLAGYEQPNTSPAAVPVEDDAPQSWIDPRPSDWLQRR